MFLLGLVFSFGVLSALLYRLVTGGPIGGEELAWWLVMAAIFPISGALAPRGIR